MTRDHRDRLGPTSSRAPAPFGLSTDSETMPPRALQLQISRAEGNGQITLSLIGELDLATVDDLRAALGEISFDAETSVVLDLSELTFVDSSGLAALVEGRERAEAHGSQLVLRSPQAQARRLLGLVGLLDRLTHASLSHSSD